MENAIPPTKRRGFLRSALVFFGSALGVTAAGSKPAPELLAAAGTRLRLYATSRNLSAHVSGQTGPGNDRRSRRGKLLARPNGEVMGEYYATCLCQPGAFGAHLAESPEVELQTFRLADGTLFGAGANERSPAGGSVHAILGGTGRYAATRGTFSLTPLRQENGAEEWVEIEINLLS